ERVGELRDRIAADPALGGLPDEERDQASGEIRALLWALGEDRLTQQMRMIFGERGERDPTQTDRAVTATLIMRLEASQDVEERAGAAYELGKLKIAQAIPRLVAALDDAPLVAEMAAGALRSFSEEELAEAGVSVEVRERIRVAR